ncbi:MAG TPA: cytochrome c [Pyrinomonadaceae bacterium]|jgi:mono/diheme cytochrome c family protein
MKTFVKCVVLFVTFLLCGGFLLRSSHVGARARAEDVETKSVARGQTAQAAKLFNEKCARCHGADGRGRTVIGDMLGTPDFTNEKWWEDDKSERRFVQSITNGKGEMPAFGKKLSRREVGNLAAYVRGFRQKPAR